MGTNNFSQETKDLFCFNYKCWETEKNNVCDYHHIVRRHNKNDDCESSPLNCAPLNRKSHDRGDIHSKEKETKYLNKTIDYLVSQGYELTEKDNRFLNKYKNKYLIK